MTNRLGGCACGAVRYELSADPVAQVACYCRACQYASGGAPTLAMIVPMAALSVTKGTPRAYWSEGDSGGKVARNFCETCGSPLFSEPAGSGIAVIKVGSLDDPSDFKPGAEIWMGAAQPWHQPHEGTARFPGNFG